MKELKHSHDNIVLTDKERQARIKKAAEHFGKFMNIMGFDFENDPNAYDTPNRVAKAYMNDICSGCFTQEPKVTAFDNVDKYDGIVCETNIPVVSICAHHWLPFTGVAHVAYIPSPDGKIIGLSKLNRMVEWQSRRPHVQENLVVAIHNAVSAKCEGNLGVAVIIKASHSCVSCRGVRNNGCDMITSKLSGDFMTDEKTRNEFYKFIDMASR